MAVVAGLLPVAATAADGLGRLDRVGEAYNQAARQIGASTRMVLLNCTSEDAAACRYSLTGEMTAVALAARRESPAQMITIIYGPNSEAVEFLTAIGVTMQALSPRSDREERGQALSQLTGAIKAGGIADVVLGDVRYRLGAEKAKGVVLFSATAR